MRGQRTRTNARTRKGPRRAIRKMKSRVHRWHRISSDADHWQRQKPRAAAPAVATPAQLPQRQGAKKIKQHVVDGIAHVHSTFNNTIVTITDRRETR